MSSEGFALPGKGRGRSRVQQVAPKPDSRVTNATADTWGSPDPVASNGDWDKPQASSSVDGWGSGWGSGGGSDANNNNSTGGASDPWGASNGGGGGDPWGNSGGGYDSGSRGGGGPRSKGCFNCHQEGHMSKDCPSKRNNYSSNNRFNDRRRIDSHSFNNRFSDRRSGGSGGGGRGRGCFNCGEEGHQSRDCPNPKTDSRGPMKCYNCQGEGHQSRDCPNPRQEREPRSQKCFNCQGEGHQSRDCPEPKQEREPRSQKCFNCQGEGHQSRDCPEPQRERSLKCYNCQQEGHQSKDCTNEAAPRIGADGREMAPLYVAPDISQDPEVLFDSLSVGINFDRYDKIPVEVDDARFRTPCTSFEEMEFCALIRENISRLSYQKPTPVQKYAIPIILRGMDLMACAQTGSGKTAAFMLPIMHKLLSDPDIPNPSWQECQEPLAVVLAPTRELAIQIATDANRYAYGSILKIVLVYGGTSVKAQQNQLLRGCHILVGTTGRLKDYMDKGVLSFSRLRFLVLDEADRMLDMGFEPDVRRIVGHASMPAKGERQTLMFSATFPPSIQQLAREFLGESVRLSVGILGSANQDVTQTIIKVSKFEKRDKLLEMLRSEKEQTRVMVFVETKRNADFLASYISQVGLKTTSIHGDRFQNQREEALNDFKRGRCPVIVATAVAARGLDIKEVRHVINYDLPKTIDEYVHRVGRTGRVGNTGLATSFYDPEQDRELLPGLVKTLADSQQEVPDWLEAELRGGGGGMSGGGGGMMSTGDGEGWGAGGANGGGAAVEEETWG